MNILRMINPVQPYAWGSKTFINDLLGIKEMNCPPQAELWLGAHPKASSLIQNGEQQVNLNYIIAEDPSDFLGNAIARSFNDQLPFLLKVLAASAPLSIQAHPNQKQAIKGFAREEKLSIPIDADNRNYKDTNHKPELMVALTPFTAMCGFRPFTDLINYLKTYLHEYSSTSLVALMQDPNPMNLKALFTSLMSLNLAERQRLLDSYLKQLKTIVPETEQEKLIKEWSNELHQLYPYDIGVLAPLLLNIIVLKPFEALYLDSGVLHSYLSGSGMEIMANSDNVLRGGLTPKYIDTNELLNILEFEPHLIKAITPHQFSETERVYPTTTVEFRLSTIKHDAETETNLPFAGSPEILFCYEGSFSIENCSQIITLEKGQSVFIPFEVDGYSVQGKGLLFRARCNL